MESRQKKINDCRDRLPYMSGYKLQTVLQLMSTSKGSFHQKAHSITNESLVIEDQKLQLCTGRTTIATGKEQKKSKTIGCILAIPDI